MTSFAISATTKGDQSKPEVPARPLIYARLQVPRGLAAMMVVAHHSSNMWSSKVAGLETIYGSEKGASFVLTALRGLKES